MEQDWVWILVLWLTGCLPLASDCAFWPCLLWSLFTALEAQAWLWEGRIRTGAGGLVMAEGQGYRSPWVLSALFPLSPAPGQPLNPQFCLGGPWPARAGQDPDWMFWFWVILGKVAVLFWISISSLKNEFERGHLPGRGLRVFSFLSRMRISWTSCEKGSFLADRDHGLLSCTKDSGAQKTLEKPKSKISWLKAVYMMRKLIKWHVGWNK